MKTKSIIIQSTVVLKNAMELLAEGHMEEGILLLKQQADTMLMMAIQLDHVELRERAQVFYNMLNYLDSSMDWSNGNM